MKPLPGHIVEAIAQALARAVVKAIRAEQFPILTGREDPERILTAHELKVLVPLNRATIYQMVRKGEFPKPVNMTPSRIGWRRADVLAWMDQRQRDGRTRRQFFGRPVKEIPDFHSLTTGRKKPRKSA